MHSSPLPIEPVRKIAVLRANGIGDFVFTLPALHALRKRFRDAEIVLLGQPWHEPFLSVKRSPVDRVVIIPRYPGVGEPEDLEPDPAAVHSFFQAMRGEEFDIAIQLHGGGRFSNPFVKHLGARLTVGLATPDAEQLDLQLPYIYFQPEIIRYLETVSLLGAEPVGLEPSLTVLEEDLNESLCSVPDDSGPFVVLHPGASASRRRWSTRQFAAVGDRLLAAGYRVVITGSQPEYYLADAVASAMDGPAEIVCHLTLGGFLGLLSRSALLVSNDSGPLHLASAVGRPTVGIFWCGNMITAGLPTRRRHRPLLSWRLECPRCGRNTIHDPCNHEVSFVEDVSVDEVTRAAFQLLGREERRKEDRRGQNKG